MFCWWHASTDWGLTVKYRNYFYPWVRLHKLPWSTTESNAVAWVAGWPLAWKCRGIWQLSGKCQVIDLKSGKKILSGLFVVNFFCKVFWATPVFSSTVCMMWVYMGGVPRKVWEFHSTWRVVTLEWASRVYCKTHIFMCPLFREFHDFWENNGSWTSYFWCIT